MSSVLSFRVGVFDRLTLRTITLLEYDVVDEPDLKDLYFSDSLFVSENAIPLRPGSERVEMLNPPISVRHIERFFKYVEIARIVSLFVETMVEMCEDSDNSRTRVRNLARILARGGETLADIVSSSPEPLIGIIQVASLYKFDRLHKLAIQCMAVLLSVPQETKWTKEDEKKVWSSLEKSDVIILRRDLFGLSWYKSPEALRFRAVRDLCKMWQDDLVIPANQCLEEAVAYLQDDFITDDASPLGHLSNRIKDPLSRAFAISRVASSLAMQAKKLKKSNVEMPSRIVESVDQDKPSFKERIECMQRRLRRDEGEEEEEPINQYKPSLNERIDSMKRRSNHVEEEEEEEEEELVVVREKKNVAPKSLLLLRAKSRSRRQSNDKENNHHYPSDDNKSRKISHLKEKKNTPPKSLLFVKQRSRLNVLARPRGPIMKKRESSSRNAWR